MIVSITVTDHRDIGLYGFTGLCHPKDHPIPTSFTENQSDFARNFRDREITTLRGSHSLYGKLFFLSPSSKKEFFLIRNLIKFLTSLNIEENKHTHTHTRPCIHIHTQTHTQMCMCIGISFPLKYLIRIYTT